MACCSIPYHLTTPCEDEPKNLGIIFPPGVSTKNSFKLEDWLEYSNDKEIVFKFPLEFNLIYDMSSTYNNVLISELGFESVTQDFVYGTTHGFSRLTFKRKQHNPYYDGRI